MKGQIVTKSSSDKVLIKKCHICGQIMESSKEVERCVKCRKAFLPSNYFGKVHAKNSEEYKNLFCHSNELHPEDLITGITVLW